MERRTDAEQLVTKSKGQCPDLVAPLTINALENLEHGQRPDA